MWSSWMLHTSQMRSMLSSVPAKLQNSESKHSSNLNIAPAPLVTCLCFETELLYYIQWQRTIQLCQNFQHFNKWLVNKCHLHNKTDSLAVWTLSVQHGHKRGTLLHLWFHTARLQIEFRLLDILWPVVLYTVCSNTTHCCHPWLATCSSNPTFVTEVIMSMISTHEMSKCNQVKSLSKTYTEALTTTQQKLWKQWLHSMQTAYTRTWPRRVHTIHVISIRELLLWFPWIHMCVSNDSNGVIGRMVCQA